jgi:hypothetical protein
MVTSGGSTISAGVSLSILKWIDTRAPTVGDVVDPHAIELQRCLIVKTNVTGDNTGEYPTRPTSRMRHVPVSPGQLFLISDEPARSGVDKRNKKMAPTHRPTPFDHDT